MEVIQKEKPRKFKMHFNRINMQRDNHNVWTVCTSKECFQAESVHCKVPVISVYKPTARQPRAYFVGTGHIIQIGNSVFILPEVTGWTEKLKY